jgi:thiamine-monophosphate kinase
MPSEFDIIDKYFAPLTDEASGALGLRDDAAFLTPPPLCDLVLTKDAIVEGVHFRPQDPADLVARKLVRVNLSDLAAKGAKPLGYLLATAFREDTSEEWIETFARGLGEDQSTFDWNLLGGDTVSTPGPLMFSLTAIGTVPIGKMIKRSGAQVGDDLYVTGCIGDAALGLRVLEEGVLSGSNEDYLARRYLVPCPRLAVGPALQGIASAMVDVSDGLIADTGHLADASSLKVEINALDVPVSGEACGALETFGLQREDLLSGGDDYELCFGCPSSKAEAVARVARQTGVAITRIGHFSEGTGVRALGLEGIEISLKTTGYRHF